MSCRLLPEWYPQDAILLAWPHADTDWQTTLAAIQQTYVAIIKHITRFQRVVLIVPNAIIQAEAETVLRTNSIDNAQIIYVQAPYNDTWLRDTGPISCGDDQGRIQLHDFRFNGWGGKFDARLDDKLCAALFEQPLFVPRHQHHDIFLEGGSIDSDGLGSVLTTSRCLLTPTRNPAMDKQAYQDYFARYFQIQRLLWIEHGELQGDDTDSHIDMLARFCDSQTIAYTACHDARDEHFESLAKLEAQLRGLTQANGQPYTLVPLALPQAKKKC